MEEQTNKEKINAVIDNYCKQRSMVSDDFEIKPDHKFDTDLDFDSLDKVELIMEIEKEFFIRIPDDIEFETVEECIEKIIPLIHR